MILLGHFGVLTIPVCWVYKQPDIASGEYVEPANNPGLTLLCLVVTVLQLFALLFQELLLHFDHIHH